MFKSPHTRSARVAAQLGSVVGETGVVVVCAALLLALLASFGAPRTIDGIDSWTPLEAGIGLFVAGVVATAAWSPLNR